MCSHDKQTVGGRIGDSIADGDAHRQDHSSWSRRTFLNRFLVGSAGVSLSVSGRPLQAFGSSPLLKQLEAAETDRILVLVQMAGGNDGLNTVVPYTNDLYYQRRPVLGLAREELLPLNDTFGLHPSLAPLHSFWEEGNMGIVSGVGYPDPNLSPFRSTDIWVSASDSDDVVDTGWLGRYLDLENPEFNQSSPESPLALQIGTSLPMLFQSPVDRMGISFHSVGSFELVAERGAVFDAQAVPDSPAGNQLAFLRNTANQTIRYGKSIRNAFLGASNRVEYPWETYRFADSLATVARCIRGGLGAKIYVVTLPDFDTHVNQAFMQARLLGYLADGVRAFYDDLATDGLDANVLTVSFSEFGRRVEENASRGTDHGAAAPLFVFGPQAKGGIVGEAPDLEDLDNNGNLKHSIDFRSVYTAILGGWFGLPGEDVQAALGGVNTPADILLNPVNTGVIPDDLQPGEATLLPNYPNPAQSYTRIRFELKSAAHVRLQLYDLQGRRVSIVTDRTHAAGRHEVRVNVGDLPSGTYLCRLELPSGSSSRMLQVVR
ncbi:MAG: DUF1501 domain-containing protein [Rhodothermales bacterium]|nr:DUF1501 domain-containing protein [Rhodothermales bacterium]